jgi:hypothetical protein
MQANKIIVFGLLAAGVASPIVVAGGGLQVPMHKQAM